MSLNFGVVSPNKLDVDQWSEIHNIYHEAIQAELGDRRSEDEINYLTRWNDFEGFHKSHLDPNSEVGIGNSFTNQSYISPKVAVAWDGDNIIGFGCSANNVFGSQLGRRLKLLGSPLLFNEKYHCLGEFAVRQDYQRQGVATQMARMSLSLRSIFSPMQPVITYVYPDEFPSFPPVLEAAGFVPKFEREVTIYGKGSEPVREVTMLASSASKVVGKVIRKEYSFRDN